MTSMVEVPPQKCYPAQKKEYIFNIQQNIITSCPLLNKKVKINPSWNKKKSKKSME